MIKLIQGQNLMIQFNVTDRILMDPFHFGLPDPDPFHETDLGSKNQLKSWKNSHKNQQKSQIHIS